MIKLYTYIFNTLFLIGCCFIVQAQDKKLVTNDFIYEPSIKSASLYPVANPPDINVLDMNRAPVLPLSQESTLLLEFDELGSNPQNYYVKIINCNADWTASQLNEIQYLDKYNEYPILDRQLSYNTRVGFVHYKLFLPRVLVSGNYLVLVYRDGDSQNMILTKRFVVYEPLLLIKTEPKFPMNVNDRNTGQQIDFTINYSKTDLINPLASLKIVLRQNHRWDNAITNIKPSFIDEGTRNIQYYFFNRENVFDGVNEFRFFDIRSNKFAGINVASARFDADKTEIMLREDVNRSKFAYSFYNDNMDGKYVIDNYETGDRELQADYVNVNFQLNNSKLPGEVYVMGGFNNWQCNENVRMTYNTAINRYQCKVLLKQGQYNYRYAYKEANQSSANESYMEGSYSITQNLYDILVYYRPFGVISDRVIGYSSLNYNGR